MIAHCTFCLLLLLAAHCLFQPSAFACHLVRSRGPTPRLPACCVRLLRARAAACSVSSASAAAGRVAAAAGWCCRCCCRCCRCQILRSAHSSSFSFSASSARTGFGRREIFLSEGAAAYAHVKKSIRYVAARLCALCFVSLCACALCVCSVRHYLLFHFHFGGERPFAAHNNLRARTRTLSRVGCQRFRAPAAAHCDLCIGACCLARACGPRRFPFFLCCARSPPPLVLRRVSSLLRAPPPLPPLAAAPPRPVRARSHARHCLRSAEPCALPVFLVSAAPAPAAPRAALCVYFYARLPAPALLPRAASGAGLSACLFSPCVRCPARARAVFARYIDSPPAPLSARAHLGLRRCVARRARAATACLPACPAIPPARAGFSRCPTPAAAGAAGR